MATGQGLKVYVSEAANFEGAVVVGHLTSVGELGAEVEAIEVTDLDSEVKEYEPGLMDYGTCELSGNLKAQNEGYAKLQEFVSKGTVFNMWVVHPTLTVVNTTFTAFVQSIKRGALETGSQIGFSATVQVCSLPKPFTPPVTP